MWVKTKSQLSPMESAIEDDASELEVSNVSIFKGISLE